MSENVRTLSVFRVVQFTLVHLAFDRLRILYRLNQAIFGPSTIYILSKAVALADLNANLETLSLAPTHFYHLFDFYPKTGFLRNHPLSLFQSTYYLLTSL